MKRILITGKNSYIGNSFENWIADDDSFHVEKISLREDNWKGLDFSKYDVIFHVAGIAHVSSDPKMEEKYYKVNKDLTMDVAKKAKDDGVKQFIFMSSIIVYGDSTEANGIITKSTPPDPSNFYGNSKLQAEEGVRKLQSDRFNVVIIRPPMIYGKGSKGNYPKLAKLAKITPVFPDFPNKRSMLHIDNLCEFIKLMIINNENGLFFPQNEEFVNTSELVQVISKTHKKKIWLISTFNPVIKKLLKFEIVNKVFGNLVYEKSMSTYESGYQLRNLEDSIKLTERE
ncbi:putative UDP-sugar epimerase [Tetragenococcus halophilus]|uniref:NAD-dependent epimerase/dehydratase family protein n=1 Tax=Tetragenococcus halophilus TaxID=51669 RepID=UPI0019275708|nr:NAD-dependent epimerase/dehydratase family protein [Tetragenococcus halophilus]GEQ37764.1 putative UDP-sugar epimerase [Tetragenococcus halophilus]GEQ40037.1 putative UDP-sugar epimerase [Tetragenococcus halophilus]GEQ42141.1 putative UDP-sugar epimerase [Tetragenococcus halophilus]GEQ44474.1 putative UDP-sugar epimerase [Tetragenococcus halophilus]GEQ46802.1 putative UDP-sugar epimerase [Tetragenococcus halophilus]